MIVIAVAHRFVGKLSRVLASICGVDLATLKQANIRDDVVEWCCVIVVLGVDMLSVVQSATGVRCPA